MAEGGRGMFTGIDFLARPCVPSPVSSIRTPKLPLLHVWEKGVGGMRGKLARNAENPFYDLICGMIVEQSQDGGRLTHGKICSFVRSLIEETVTW